MTKHLNEDGLRSELAGSAFFNGPTKSEPALPAKPALSSPRSEPTLPDTNASPVGRTPEPSLDSPDARTPGRRVITRYAFEFFQDQVARLRAISLQAKLRGEDGSMSEMVRDALDAYLAHRKEATPQ